MPSRLLALMFSYRGKFEESSRIAWKAAWQLKIGFMRTLFYWMCNITSTEILLLSILVFFRNKMQISQKISKSGFRQSEVRC